MGIWYIKNKRNYENQGNHESAYRLHDPWMEMRNDY